jgi:hypothetical protein
MSAAAKEIEQSDLSNEVVVGSRSGYHEPNVQRTDSGDRVEERLTTETIDRLRLDAEIEADVSLLADSIFFDGIEIVPAVLDEEDPEFDRAKEIAEFMAKATESRRPLTLVLKEMFKAAFYNGVKVAEIVLKYRSDARVDGKLVLDRVNPKPVSATAFVTDKFNNVVGLVGAKASNGGAVSSGTISLTDEEIISPEKFLILAFELEDNDPRGLSQVRAIIEDYCDKKVTRSQWKEWRRTSAIPKKVGVTAPGAKDVVVKNSDGTVRERISAQRALMNGLEAFANNSAITAEDGTDIKQLEVSGTGVQFERHYKTCNGEIRKVILGDALATGAADKDARAARESSKDVVDIRKQALRTIVAAAVKRDIYRLLTVVNFGEEKAHLTPDCFLGDTEANDWAGDLQAASRAGYTFAPEHMAQLDSQFGLDPRTESAEVVDTKEAPAAIDVAGEDEA